MTWRYIRFTKQGKCITITSYYRICKTTTIPGHSASDGLLNLWWPTPVPSRRDVVNPVRPGREQRQQRNRVPGCGWLGRHPYTVS